MSNHRTLLQRLAASALKVIGVLLLIPTMSAFSEPPSQSGPVVSRGTEIPAWFWYSKDDLMAIHGLDVANACNTGEPYSELWSAKLISSPSKDETYMTLTKGDSIGTWVYPNGLFEFLPDGSIDQEAACLKIWFDPSYQQPIASGQAQVITNRNNHTDAPISRANRTHISAHGMLTNADGGKVIFSGGFGCVLDGPEESCTSRVNIH